MTVMSALRKACALQGAFFGLGTVAMILRGEEPQLIAVSAWMAIVPALVGGVLLLLDLRKVRGDD